MITPQSDMDVKQVAKDIKACASDALDALKEGDYSGCRTLIQAVLNLAERALNDEDEAK